jgi:acetyl/propionyl-CoA carboxylase alpha subunit
MITGLDLVEWQLRIAAVTRFRWSKGTFASKGMPIEARIYAEDPGARFLAGHGTIAHLSFQSKPSKFGSMPASPPAARSRRGTTR